MVEILLFIFLLLFFFATQAHNFSVAFNSGLFIIYGRVRGPLSSRAVHALRPGRRVAPISATEDSHNSPEMMEH